jgi:hypothetical protein
VAGRPSSEVARAIGRYRQRTATGHFGLWANHGVPEVMLPVLGQALYNFRMADQPSTIRPSTSKTVTYCAK